MVEPTTYIRLTEVRSLLCVYNTPIAQRTELVVSTDRVAGSNPARSTRVKDYGSLRALDARGGGSTPPTLTILRVKCYW